MSGHGSIGFITSNSKYGSDQQALSDSGMYSSIVLKYAEKIERRISPNGPLENRLLCTSDLIEFITSVLPVLVYTMRRIASNVMWICCDIDLFSYSITVPNRS